MNKRFSFLPADRVNHSVLMPRVKAPWGLLAVMQLRMLLSKISSELRPHAISGLCVVGIATVVFALDLTTGHDVAIGVLYTPIVVLGIFRPQIPVVLSLAGVATVLLVIGALLPTLPPFTFIAIANLAVSFFAIWLSAGAVVFHVNRSRAKDRMFHAYRQHLQNDRNKAQSEVQARGHFIADLSHELRTPLNAIIGFSDMMRRGVMDDKGIATYKDYAEHIFTSGEHLLNLVNNILDISKLESGKYDLDEKDVHFSDLIKSVMPLVQGMAEQKSITLSSEVSSSVPLMVGDPMALRQVLVNLLSNAIKFTPEGGLVAVRVSGNKTDGIEMQVIDSGIGIAPENIDKVFQPYGQIKTDDGDNPSGEYKGTGLGLPLCRELIRLHGGSFDLDSMPGVGTNARVKLPFYRVAELPLSSGMI